MTRTCQASGSSASVTFHSAGEALFTANGESARRLKFLVICV